MNLIRELMQLIAILQYQSIVVSATCGIQRCLTFYVPPCIQPLLPQTVIFISSILQIIILKNNSIKQRTRMDERQQFDAVHPLPPVESWHTNLHRFHKRRELRSSTVHLLCNGMGHMNAVRAHPNSTRISRE
jgi:hypothetical protein